MDAAERADRRRVAVLGVSDTAFGVLLEELHGYASVEVIDFADSSWSRLQCLEVRRLHGERHTLGGLGDGVAAFAERLAAHCAERGYDLVVPVNDGAVELGRRARALRPLPLAVPPDGVARFAHDKRLLLEEAGRAGLGVPRYELLSSRAELEERASFALPAFFKPVHTAVVRDDRLLKFGARRVETRERLVNLGREVLPSVPAMVQEICPGFGVGYTFLAHEGVPLVEAFHRRLHEPLGGEGGSTYRMTVPPFPEDVLAACRRLVGAIRWSGVGMLELRYDPATGSYAVMELNGRLWGSLALHVAAGCDYPRYMLDYYLEKRRVFPVATAVSVRARNVPRDVAWLARRVVAPDLGWRSRLRLVREWLASWSHVLRGREALDFLRWPHLDVFALHLVTPLADRALRAAEKLRERARSASFSVRRAAYRKRLSRALARRSPSRCLFVCHGNINRSAFAAAYARRVTPRGVWNSAGLHPVPSRRPPLAAERIARDFGVDLGGHSSRVLDASLVRSADVVLVFDGRDAREVSREFPQGANRIVPLGVLARDERRAVIPDPGGGTEDTYRRVFTHIRSAVDGLVAEGGRQAAEHGRARYVLRIDDVHPRMNRRNFVRVRALLARFGVRPVAGVIPDCRQRDLLREETYSAFWPEMRDLRRQGWTIALHGYTHERLTRNGGLLHTSRSSEFAGLPYEEQRARLARGRLILDSHGLGTTVFMAPWHSFDRNTVRALRTLGFDALTDGDGVSPYEKDGLLWVPQQLGTPRSVPFGLWTFALHTDGMTEEQFRALEAFLEKSAPQVVPFEEARTLRVAAPERVAGAAAVGLVRLLRRARGVRAALAT
jgi:protein-tyrosine-phosphatase/predicted ATP-grasp superfamily ATP-dependent carboligase/predicted deacetylase